MQITSRRFVFADLKNKAMKQSACAVGKAVVAASLLVLLRAGLLGFVAFNLVEQVLIYMPVTTDFSAWYAGISTMSLLLIASLASYGFWAACRHRHPRAAE